MEELDLKELFRIFWVKKAQIILLVAIFIVIGLIYSLGFVKPVYSSTTSLVLASSNSNSASKDDNSTTITTTDLTVNSKLVATYSEIVRSKDVLRKVISNLNINIDEEILKKNITVNSVKNTELIEITVTNENAIYAEKIANEIAQVFMEKIKEIYNIENVKVLDVAELEEEPSNINYKRDIVIFAGAGVIIAIVYVLISNMLDTTIKEASEIEATYQLPVLVSIPIYEENIQKNKKVGRK